MRTNRWAPLFAALSLSEKFADLSDHRARLFYTLLHPHADDWGRFEVNSRVLNATVWPMLGESAQTTTKVLVELNRVGLIDVFQVGDGREFAQITGFEDKAGTVGKRDHRRASLFPSPGDGTTNVGPDWPGPAQAGPRARAGTRARNPDPIRSDPIRAEHEPEPENPPTPRGGEPPSAAVAVPARRSKSEVADLEKELEGHPPWLASFAHDWTAYRRQKRLDEFTPIGLRSLLNRCLRWGEPRCRAAMEHSSANGWQGLIEPDARGQNGQAQTESSATRAIRGLVERGRVAL